jgi:Protein of unknown function (DUF1638)
MSTASRCTQPSNARPCQAGEGSDRLAGAVILACEMIEDEVRLALEALAPEDRPPVVWVESGLHERPERLRAALKAILESLDEGARAGSAVSVPSVRPGPGPASARRDEVLVAPVKEVLFALGFCGNALNGLTARHLSLVIPRVDDCISLLLNRGCVREKIPRNARHYYLTRGWFSHESSLKEVFADWDQRFGPERAAKLRKTMFAGYERVSLIDTQAYDVEECLDQSRDVAEELELEHGIVQGSVQLLERLFRGERDSEIVVVPPGGVICFDHLVGAGGAEERSQSSVEDNNRDEGEQRRGD